MSQLFCCCPCDENHMSAWNLRVYCSRPSGLPSLQGQILWAFLLKYTDSQQSQWLQRIYCFLKYGVYGRHQQVWVQVVFLSYEVNLSPTMGCWYTIRLMCWKDFKQCEWGVVMSHLRNNVFMAVLCLWTNSMSCFGLRFVGWWVQRFNRAWML